MMSNDIGFAKSGSEMDELEVVLVRATRCHCEVNAARAGAHLSAELEQLEANGSLCRTC
jgi:hypothetical protein